MIHGLCMSGDQWLHQGVDHGAMLAQEKGYLPLYLDYNSGRAIADNGRDLAAVLQALAARAEVEEIVVVAHSMGGLVLRSAMAHGGTGAKLSRAVFLGTPHLGAPLERAGNWITTIAELNAYSAPFAQLARLRSAGIRDLRHGSRAPLEWEGQVFAVAGELGRSGTDGLVPVDSALGAGVLECAEAIALPRTGHMELLSAGGVAELLRRWL